MRSSIRRLVFLVFPPVGFALHGYVSGFPRVTWVNEGVVGLLVGVALAGLDVAFERGSFRDLIAGSLGGGVGLLLTGLLLPPVMAGFPELQKPGLSLYTYFFLLALGGYFGVQQGMSLARKWPSSTGGDGTNTHVKVLDTSVIIDGRVAEIIEIGFLEGTFVVPRFVLKELQNMADSGNKLKRNRGRRGLDILNRIRQDLPVPVQIAEQQFPDIDEVDAKLVALAQQLNAKILTNDFNLNKVASLQDVRVLNINDLSNAVKPVFIPGETFEIEVIKEGEEQEQGVGYLDDGTMVVIENGRDYVGQTIPVTVTSVIQTSAGRMIFSERGEKLSD